MAQDRQDGEREKLNPADADQLDALSVDWGDERW
jgi:hypothetical protein